MTTDIAPPQTAGVLAPPPLIYATGLAAGLAVQAAIGRLVLPAAVRWPVGGPLLGAGGVLAAAFLVAMRRAGTPVDPGRPTSALVTGGPFRLTRNPVYLAMALTYAGIAFAAGAPWPLLTLVPTLAVVQRGVIAREERYLSTRFGAAYRAYRERTRRWL